MKKLVVVILLGMLSFSLLSQGFEGEEYNGRVELLSGEQVTGDIYYEAATGKLIITGDKGSEYYTARSVSYFEFYDFERNLVRQFYSLLYSNTPTFFELLKETSNLALLSRENISTPRAVAYLAKNENNIAEISGSASEVKATSETLYLADEKGKIEPYVVINSNKLGASASYVTPYLLSSLTKSKFAELRKFAKDNRYSLKNKEHLIELLDYYDSLLSKSKN